MKGKIIGEGGVPLICTPLVGATREAVLEELAAVLPKRPDVVEWRADFFEKLADGAAVVELGREIKKNAAGCSVIFTIRSRREGGQPIALTDRQVIELLARICKETEIEYVDCELGNAPDDIGFLRDIAHAGGTLIIASFHDFHRTPDRASLMRKITDTEALGLDVAKIAVMPTSLEDVLTLLSVTLEAKRSVGLPLITMSMGGDGAVSRMIGGVFGSSLSFAVGRSASAPGQIPIEELRTVLEIVERSKAGR